MPRLAQCSRCQLFAASPYLVCAVHPHGPEGETCLDFAPNAATVAQEQWQMLVPSYYAGEPISGFARRMSYEEQLDLISWHPLFTGQCPSCGAGFDRTNPPLVHWDCEGCGWMDDSV